MTSIDDIELRMATSADIPLLKAWDEQLHVKAAIGEDDDWQWTAEDLHERDWRESLIAEKAGVSFAFVQIIDPAQEETQYWGDVAVDLRAMDIWIGPPDYLNKGLGSVVMRMALAHIFDGANVAAVLIDPLASNVAAQRFYARFGFRFVEERVFDKEPCFVMRLERADWSG